MPPQQRVAGAAAGQAGGAAAGGQQQQQGGVNQLVATVLRFGLMWYVMSYFKPGQQPQQPGSMAAPLYHKGDMVDMYVFLSEQPDMAISNRGDASLVWQTELSLAVTPERTITYNYRPSLAVQNNGSVYAHIVFARGGTDLDTPLDEMPPDSVFSKTVDLVRYLPPRQNKTGVNLLTDSANFTATKASANATEPKVWAGHLKPNLTIAMVDHFTAYPKNAIPPPVMPHLQFNAEGQQYPLVYVDEFWLLRDKLVPLNASVDDVDLHITVKPMSGWWMQLQQQMEQSFQHQITLGLAQDGEADEMKRVFLEGNPYLLALTMAVSLLHSVFDFLAFKNDIGFWKDNKSMEGLSARSIVINAVCQLIIFLYLLDNETSMVVLFSAGAGTAIEFWKVTKAMDVSLAPSWPYLIIKDRASYSNNPTKEYDRAAMRYLSYALYPLVIGYSVYALVYETHRSWYSWILGSLVGAVYTFGFILMCPQLYLNYKLKSVAHLPWRQMTYKFLNTIIDDLFAFVIKMPTMHRISVFRDDIIFLIYVYQRWIYRVDMTRVNEFGFSGTAAEEAAAAAAAGAANGSSGEAGAVLALEGPGDGDKAAGSTRRRRGGAAAGVAAADGDSSQAAAGAADAADGGPATDATKKSK